MKQKCIVYSVSLLLRGMQSAFCFVPCVADTETRLTTLLVCTITVKFCKTQDIDIIYSTAGTLKYLAVKYFCLLYDLVQQKQLCPILPRLTRQIV